MLWGWGKFLSTCWEWPIAEQRKKGTIAVIVGSTFCTGGCRTRGKLKKLFKWVLVCCCQSLLSNVCADNIFRFILSIIPSIVS
jgi:hypothetical protein